MSEDSLFGGLNVNNDHDNASNEGMTSGFSFMTDSSANNIGDDAENISSGFSFLSASAPDTIVDNYEADVTATSMSSGNSAFSFLNMNVDSSTGHNSTYVHDDADVTNPTYSTPLSSGLGGAAVLSMIHEDSLENKEIKLSKVASTKTVKKKKKTPKVGYGREEENQDAEANDDIPDPVTHDQHQTVQTHPAEPETLLSPPEVRDSHTKSLANEISNSNELVTTDHREIHGQGHSSTSHLDHSKLTQSPALNDTGTAHIDQEDHVSVSQSAVQASSVRGNESQRHDATDNVAALKQQQQLPQQQQQPRASKPSGGSGFLSLFGFGKSNTAEEEPATQTTISAPVSNNNAHSAATEKKISPMPMSVNPTNTAKAPGTNTKLPHVESNDLSQTPVESNYSETAARGLKLDDSSKKMLPTDTRYEDRRHNETTPASLPNVAYSSSSSTPSLFEGLNTSTTPPVSDSKKVEKSSVVSANSTSGHVSNGVSSPTSNSDNVDLFGVIRKLTQSEIQTFKASVNALVLKKTQLAEQSKYVQEEQVNKARYHRQLKKKVEELEIEQQRFAEIEDFESADALTSQLERVREEVNQTEKLQSELKQNSISIESEIAELRKAQFDLMDRSVKGLGNLKRQQEEELMSYIEKSTTELNKLNEKIKSEEDRISLEKNHVEREESVILEESETIEKAIHSQTSQVQEHKDELDMQLLGVSSEIKNLEMLLIAKKEEEKRIRSELVLTESKIDEVRKKYERQLQRIYDRSSAIASAKNECLKEESSIRKDREVFNAREEGINSIRYDIENWLLNMKQELDMTGTIQDVLAGLNSNDEVEVLPTVSVDTSNINALQHEVLIAEDVYFVSQTSLKAAKDRVEALRNEDAEISEKIPQLETEKKSHASNKRFKEAASVANTLKALSTRREDIVELLRAAESSIVNAEQAVVDAQTTLDTAMKAFKNAEREIDVLKLDRTVSRVKVVRKACDSVRKAIELEVNDTGIAAISLFLLEAELKEILAVANSIISKHNIEKSLDDMIAESIENEVEEGIVDDQVTDTQVANDGQENTTSPHEDNMALDTGSVIANNDLDNSETPAAESLESESERLDDSDPHKPEDSNQQTHQMISEAKAMIEDIAKWEKELENAVDSEDYDKAAELSEKVDHYKDDLAKILSKLSYTKEDVLLFESTSNN